MRAKGKRKQKFPLGEGNSKCKCHVNMSLFMSHQGFTPGCGCDFARAHVMGVEYTCCDGKAVAFAWAPAAEQRERAELAATILVGGRNYSVEILWCGIFGKSAIRSAVIPEGVRFLPERMFTTDHLSSRPIGWMSPVVAQKRSTGHKFNNLAKLSQRSSTQG